MSAALSDSARRGEWIATARQHTRLAAAALAEAQSLVSTHDRSDRAIIYWPAACALAESLAALVAAADPAAWLLERQTEECSISEH